MFFGILSSLFYVLQCSTYIPLEHIRKPTVFWCFQVVYKWKKRAKETMIQETYVKQSLVCEVVLLRRNGNWLNITNDWKANLNQLSLYRNTYQTMIKHERNNYLIKHERNNYQHVNLFKSYKIATEPKRPLTKGTQKLEITALTKCCLLLISVVKRQFMVIYVKVLCYLHFLKNTKFVRIVLNHF